MRLINKLLLLALFPLSVFCKEARPNIEVKTSGLVCPACGIGIKKWLKKNSSVREVKLDVKKTLVLIYLKINKNITDKQIRTAIKKAGYEPGAITRNKPRPE